MLGHFRLVVLLLSFVTLLGSCDKIEVKEINIGFIGPLTTRAIDLGIAPSKAMKLAIEEYNSSKTASQPKINFFVEDDRWEKDAALSAYKKLRKQHNIGVLFISNTDGTIAIQDKIMEDGVIAINPLNNDKLLASLNKNTFLIAKSTEEAHRSLGIRIIELGLKKVLILHFPNDFMSIAGNSVKGILSEHSVESKLVKTVKNQTDFQTVLDTQRTQLGTQDSLAGATADVSADHVRLYKALGGGLEE